MRIGFDAKRYFNNQTGLGNYSRDLVRIMSEHIPEHEYFLFAKHPHTAYPVPEGVSIITPGGSTFLWRSYGIRKDLQKHHIDLYHGLSNEIPAGLHKIGVPAVVTIHDVIFKRYPQYYPLADRLLYDAKTAYACRHARRIIATSIQTKQDLVKYYHVNPDNIDVVYQVCNPVFNQPVQTSGHFDKTPVGFLYLSSFQKRKNHSSLIRAFASIASQTLLNLTLAGRHGETYESCQTLVSQLGIRNRVNFITDLPTNLLPELYHAAAAFVYPSFFEGFGIPLLEAMQCGLPTACSRIQVFEELAADTALYFDPENPESIAHAMLQAAGSGKDETRRRYAARLGLFSDKGIAETLNHIYKNI